MDRVLSLILVASVLTMTGLVVITLTSGSLTGFNDSLDNQEKTTTCNFQVSQAKDEGNWDNVEETCLKSEYISEDNHKEAITQNIEDEIT